MKPWVYLPLIIVGIVVVSLPPAIYLIHFGNAPVSGNPSDWGVLGDFIGGILNPIISLASLCVLGYLTHLVARQSTEENKKLFLLQKKMDAYQDLTKHFRDINMTSRKIDRAMTLQPVVANLPDPQQMEHLMKMLQEMITISGTYDEFYFTLTTFKVRYSHLFKYDFDSEDFRNLIKETKKATDLFNSIIKNLTNGRADLISKNPMLSEEFRELSAKVVNQILKEVDSSSANS